jgi:hypothetical protein
MRPTDRSRHDATAQIRQAELARSASRRMIARGQRPGYRVADTGDGTTVHVVELPWLGRIAANRQAALSSARDAIAAWLGVDPAAFDLERE